MFALDFVSLLLSKYSPRQAETSMSAYIKQVAPLGFLSSEIVNRPPKPDSVVKDVKTVARGWRLQSFSSAANKLFKSAARLESEVAAEARYWDEVLAVRDNGWKVSRFPRERQALAVQFGFLEGMGCPRTYQAALCVRVTSSALAVGRMAKKFGNLKRPRFSVIAVLRLCGEPTTAVLSSTKAG